MRYAVSTYSFWHFKGPKVDPVECLDRAAAFGFDGVEVLHQQMASDDAGYVRSLKRHALLNGLDIVGFATHQGFVHPDAAVRQQHIDHTIRCIGLAADLGAPTMRINTGRWNTIKSFDDLMAARGIEPVLPGHTVDDGFGWCIAAIEQCLPAAERCGVVLGLENHWGIGRDAAGVLRILDALPSPWLMATVDTGNFLDDTLAQVRQLAPRAALVHAKTYPGGGEWYTLDLDYPALAAAIRAAGFHGYVSLEMEGREPADTAVPASLATLRAAFG
jgi:L-ribulose-5-phosphate 3-epimerase